MEVASGGRGIGSARDIGGGGGGMAVLCVLRLMLVMRAKRVDGR